MRVLKIDGSVGNCLVVFRNGMFSQYALIAIGR